jgi:hypothetical protein
MQKLALCAVFTALVACGGNNDSKVHIVTDSGSGSDATCNPLAQTGCNANEKCTWIYDLVSADGTNVLGHVGCAPDGDKAVGAQCTRNAAGTQGWDDCTKEGFCKAKRELIMGGGTGVCEQICDNNGGDPMCGTDAACVAYHNIFEVSSMNVAGVCDVKCDPFADNDPLHSDPATTPSRPGTKCQAYEGCYGAPGTTLPTSFSCAREYNTDLHDRDECTDTAGNSFNNPNPLGQVGCGTASNGCAEGYMPLLIENTGSMVGVCVAMCAPKSCWMGNCGTGTTNDTSYLTGDPAGRQCIAGKILANTTAFHQASAGPAGVNGDQCVFNWFFEIDTTNMFHTSAYDDTMGWCMDHSQYNYDSNGDGMVDANDVARPKCDTLGSAGFGTGSAVAGVCNGSNGCIGAGAFGCTSVSDSGLLQPAFGGKVNGKIDSVYVPRPRAPYGRQTQL